MGRFRLKGGFYIMEGFTFKELIKRSWLIILIIWVACLITTAFFVSRQDAIYTTSTTLVVWPQEENATFREIADSLDTLDRRSVMATYAKIISSRTVLEKTRKREEFADKKMKSYKTRTFVLPDTNILRISVYGPDPQLAADFANAVAKQASRYVKRYSDMYQLKLLDPAVPPHRPVKPDMPRSLNVGAVLGLILAFGVALLLELLRRRSSISNRAK